MLPWWIIYLLFLQDWHNVTGYDLVGYLSLTHIVHAWYLQYLFLWYVVFWLTHQFGVLYRWRYAVMGAVALVIFLWWGNIQAEQAATFVLGVWISDNKVRIAECCAAQKRRWLLAFCVVAVVSLGIKQISSIREVLDSYVLLFHAEQLLLKTSIALTVICGLGYCKALQSNRFLKFTGVISYEMYLVHLFVVPPAMRCLGIGQGYAYVALFLALSYLASYAFYMLNSRYWQGYRLKLPHI